MNQTFALILYWTFQGVGLPSWTSPLKNSNPSYQNTKEKDPLRFFIQAPRTSRFRVRVPYVSVLCKPQSPQHTHTSESPFANNQNQNNKMLWFPWLTNIMNLYRMFWRPETWRLLESCLVDGPDSMFNTTPGQSSRKKTHTHTQNRPWLDWRSCVCSSIFIILHC